MHVVFFGERPFPDDYVDIASTIDTSPPSSDVAAMSHVSSTDEPSLESAQP